MGLRYTMVQRKDTKKLSKLCWMQGQGQIRKMPVDGPHFTWLQLIAVERWFSFFLKEEQIPIRQLDWVGLRYTMLYRKNAKKLSKCFLIQGQSLIRKMTEDGPHFIWLHVMAIKKWFNISLQEEQFLIRQTKKDGLRNTLQKKDMKTLSNSYVYGKLTSKIPY